MNGNKRIVLLAAIALLGWSDLLFAEYTIILKNGRRMTVQNYREESGMIKFYGFGGEIGIAKDQVQSIVKAGGEGRGMVISGPEGLASGAAKAGQEEKRAPTSPGAVETKAGEVKEKSPEAKEAVLSPEEKLAEEKAKEEKEYQNKVRELTEQIKTVRDRYLLATRGSSGPEPTLLNTEEARKARMDDLTSRLRDAQYNPTGPSDAGGLKLSTPSPFTGAPSSTLELNLAPTAPKVDVPLPSYSDKERELSDLRNQINRLEKERERLIEQMKQKNFKTGSLFLE